MSTFAIFGEITFEVLTSWEVFRSTTDYHYAEHKVVEARPRLQWMATELQKISLEMGFHVKFTNPATQMNRLRKAAEDHQARALVFGNGVHRGYFVIESITEEHKQLADDGSFVAISATVQLNEWVQGADFDPIAQPRRSTPPPGIVKQAAGGSGTGAAAPLGTPQPSTTGNAPGAQLGTSTRAFGQGQPFNPNQPVNPHNLIPASALVSLTQPGAPSGVTFSGTPYSSAGVSAITTNGPTAAPPGNINNVSTATITRAG